MKLVDIFLEFPSFLYDPANVGNLISSSSSYSNSSLDIWKFLVHIMLKPSIQFFKHDLSSMGDECNCSVVSTFFGTILLGDWDEGWSFLILWPLQGLPDLLTYWMQHLDGIILYGFEWKVKVAQLCPTLCNPLDYTVHGILQARILEWAFPFSRVSSQPKDWTQSPT